MTDTELALLRAIAAHPDEDTPRLAFADYLDETGGACEGARAEYIRIQISRQRGLTDAATDERLYKREVDLYAAYSATWRRELPEGYNVPLIAGCRGFWNRARAPARAVLAAADDPFAQLIDELGLGEPLSLEQLQEFVRLPYARRLVSLGLPWTDAPLGAAGARVLAGAGLTRLESLSFGRQVIGDDGLRALCASVHFPALRELYLSENEITDAGVDVLLASALVPRLRKLVLRANPISRTAARTLVARCGGVVEGLVTD
jgi:uncharacterized protein (TIGR02996 family)